MLQLARLFSSRRKPTFETLDGMPPVFRHAYLRRRWSRELIVVLSPTRKLARFIADRRGRNILYVTDLRPHFYLWGAQATADVVGELIRRRRITRTLFIGGSKAGFGALLMTGLCARADPAHDFRCLAFSPQTVLYPENPNLHIFGAYKTLIDLAEKRADLRAVMEAYGDSRICANLPNARVLIVYGEKHRRDREEAAKVFGPNVEKYPLPIGFHNTLTPFVIRDTPQPDREAAIAKLFERMQRDEEARLSIPATKEELVREIDAMTWLPSMTDMIEDVMTRD